MKKQRKQSKEGTDIDVQAKGNLREWKDIENQNVGHPQKLVVVHQNQFRSSEALRQCPSKKQKKPRKTGDGFI